MIPASIRCKNPGAMWGRIGKKPITFFTTSAGPHGVPTNAPIPLRWGSTKTIYLSDGLGQDNNIAIFDTYVQGICAQIDLWRTARYKNKRFADAIATWAGGNNVPSYIALVKQRVPGMTGDTIMDDTFWRGPMAVPFLKAQSSHEAGQTYPALDSDWVEAQKQVFSTKPNVSAPMTKTTKVVVAATPIVVATGTAVSKASSSGSHVEVIILIAVVGVAILGLSWYLIHKFHKGT